jgi:hypothetical protein
MPILMPQLRHRRNVDEQTNLELNVDHGDDDFALVAGVSFGWKF